MHMTVEEVEECLKNRDMFKLAQFIKDHIESGEVIDLDDWV